MALFFLLASVRSRTTPSRLRCATQRSRLMETERNAQFISSKTSIWVIKIVFGLIWDGGRNRQHWHNHQNSHFHCLRRRRHHHRYEIYGPDSRWILAAWISRSIEHLFRWIGAFSETGVVLGNRIFTIFAIFWIKFSIIRSVCLMFRLARVV